MDTNSDLAGSQRRPDRIWGRNGGNDVQEFLVFSSSTRGRELPPGCLGSDALDFSQGAGWEGDSGFLTGLCVGVLPKSIAF